MLNKILSFLFGKSKSSEDKLFCGLGCVPDEPDNRDYVVGVSEHSIIPDEYTIPNLPEVENQGHIGSCGSFSIIKQYEILLLNHTPRRFLEGSKLFHYYTTRVKANTFPRDNGMQLRDGYKAIKTHGFVMDYIWKYDTSKLNEKPSTLAYSLGNLYKAGDYFRVYNNQDIKTFLLDDHPVIFGIPVFSSFRLLNNYGNTFWKEEGVNLGGHAMIIVGYSDKLQAYKVMNSWGKNWGMEGYCWIKYEDFTKNAFDWWVQTLP